MQTIWLQVVVKSKDDGIVKKSELHIRNET